MKIAFGCGRDLAFRGNAEHTFLTKEQIVVGVYPDDHPDPMLRGQWFVGFKHMNNADKTHKLSVHNSYVRETEMMRLPVNFDDDDNTGAAIVRYLEKMSPGQERLYCQVASDAHRKELTRQGYPNAVFYASKPLGVNSMRKLMKDAAQILGLPADFKSHSLRHMCITKMANDPGVSLAETMLVARHSSAAASRNYQAIDGVSEGNRVRALGIKVPPVAPARDLMMASSKNLASYNKPGTPMCHEKVPVATKVDTSGKYAVFEGELSPEACEMIETVHSEVEAKVEEVYKYDVEEEEVASAASTPVVLKGKKLPNMTQLAMEDLKLEMEELKSALEEEGNKKPRALSENQLKIKRMREEVKELREALYNLDKDRDSDKEEIDSLKKQLRERESDDDLYYESLEHDFDMDKRNLETELFEEKKSRRAIEQEKRVMEQENQQLTRMLRKCIRRGDAPGTSKYNKKRRTSGGR